MPVRIAADHLLTYEFDCLTGSWIPEFGFCYSSLTKTVDLEEGFTLADLFRLIQSEPTLRHFVEGYFDCDIDAIASTPCDSVSDPAVVYSYRPSLTGFTLSRNIEPDYLKLSHHCIVSEDHGDAVLGYALQMESRNRSSMGTPVKASQFQAIMNLPLIIDRTFTVYADGTAIERTKQFSLLEFLECVFFTFTEDESFQDWSENEIPAVEITRKRLHQWIVANIGPDGDGDAAAA